MRITKKFAGASCIGKQVFQPSDCMYIEERALGVKELEILEKSFLNRVENRSGIILIVCSRYICIDELYSAFFFFHAFHSFISIFHFFFCNY